MSNEPANNRLEQKQPISLIIWVAIFVLFILFILVSVLLFQSNQPDARPTPTAIIIASSTPGFPPPVTATPTKVDSGGLEPTDLPTPTLSGNLEFVAPPGLGEPALPPTPAQVAEAVCTGPPSDWTAYTIQPGDTLSALALTSGSSVSDLQRGNCLASETLIAGELFYLPRIPPSPTAVRPETTAVPPTSTGETQVAGLEPALTALPPTPVALSSPTLPQESTSLLWFLWAVMLLLLIGTLIWLWQQRRQAR